MSALDEKRRRLLIGSATLSEFPDLARCLPALVCRLGWLEYQDKAPDRAAWISKILSRIMKYPMCVAQFPEAMCDYTTAAILYFAKEDKKTDFEPRATNGHH